MKYTHEFRNGAAARALAARIRETANPGREYRFMEFCGGHTHTIFRYGLPDLLPENVRMIHGPGCPVCVLPVERLDMAIRLVTQHEVTLCSYGDMLRVPTADGRTLLKARASGSDVRMVYSAADALRIANEEPERHVVFLAVGFETTAPATAVIVSRAAEAGVRNFSVLCNHVLTPSALLTILESPEVRELGTLPIDGFVGPGHVSAVIGTRPYEFFAEEYQRPVAVAGFEPLDLLAAIARLVDMVNAGEASVANEYPRVVTRDGNEKAKQIVAEVFEHRRTFPWRGLGLVPYSGLRIRKAFETFDAEKRFDIPEIPAREPPGCRCGAVLRGMLEPTDCPLFGKRCTPDAPVGSCMVSSEGACAAYYRYRPMD